jgi:predicted RNA binding protein YcfA (HicA-like mRNA interferase family)
MGQRDVREVLKKLNKEGWHERAGKGSHRLFTKESVETTISVPTSKKELKKGTYDTIAKQAGWK